MSLTLPVTAATGACSTLRGRDLLSIRDLTRRELLALVALAADLKRQPARYQGLLSGKTLALIFEKPSLRTRVSFDVALHNLGGHALSLAPQEIGLGQREAIGDVGRTLDRMVDAIAARTFAHETVEALAQAASIPVINALSNVSHPCQALADYFTMREITGRLDGLHLAFVGDGNNVANSLICAAALVGVRMTMASPPGYEPRAEVLQWARRHASTPQDACRVTSSPEEAVDGADVVYTDTWISMGQEAEAEERRRAFAGYEVTDALLDRAAPDAIFMHCLPAHRGEEVAAEVIDSPRSVVFQQAENRVHTEKALLLALLGSEE
ncbi:MAG: ornithine carbamoyltransferase [Acidobacteria bacterium]|nr:ornithine carbamoyltransferase [Acidobacteriota bacterium]